MKYEQVPTARVRGSLPPLGPAKSDEPHGFVLPLYSLYSPRQVALATFLGTPLAGCWLVARNFKKLGSPRSGWAILVLGLAWAAGLCGLAIIDKLPGMVSLGSIPAMVLLMRGIQGDDLDRHTSLGGRRTSWAYAVGAGVASLAILFSVVVGVALAHALITEPPSVAAPNGSDVSYTSGATEADAMRLRDALTEMKYFDNPASVQVHREADRWVVTYTVQDSALRETKHGQAFADLSDEVSRRAFDGAPVDTNLIDATSTQRKRFRFEDRLRVLEVDKDQVRYRNLSEAQAATIGRVLGAVNYFGAGGWVALAELDRGRIRVELWMPEETKPTAIQDLIHQSWASELSNELDAQLDLVLGDLDGRVYATYRWTDRPEPPAIGDDGTRVFYRDGGTLKEALNIAATVLEHDTEADVVYAVVTRDDNFEPARAVVAIVNDAYDSPELQQRLHRLAEPFSRAAFGNAPVDIRIVDDELSLKVALSWEKRPKAKRLGAIRPTR